MGRSLLSGNVRAVLKDNAGWIAVLAILLVLLLAGAITAASSRGARARVDQALQATRRFARRRPHRQHFRPEGAEVAEDKPRRAAIIINPTKFEDQSAVRRKIAKGCADAGWAEPLFIETTAEDTGEGQTRQALEEGVTVVCPLGGDGTVRAVASVLVGTETPLGLLPGGTGNLLARNLDLPVDDLSEALKVALTGQNKRVDVGRIRVDASGEHERPAEHVFLVMAGLGFDAAIMAGAPEALKARVGWLAYGVAGVRNLRGAQFKVRITVDDEQEISRRVRTVVVGNCGKLTGGLVLMPKAEVDDGWLDAVTLSPKGIVGWLAVAARVLTKTRKGHERVDHLRGRELSIRSDRPEEVQLDGDTIGKALALGIRVEPGALVVRV